jgi:hypothetical protein
LFGLQNEKFTKIFFPLWDKAIPVLWLKLFIDENTEELMLQMFHTFVE